MSSHRERGFSLLELIIVMVVVGVIGAIISTFSTPLKTAFDTQMRTKLSDEIDSAYRRLARDVRRAVPNSVVTASSGGQSTLQFIPSKEGGRYIDDGSSYSLRFENSCASPPCAADRTFAVADSSGDILSKIADGDKIVINNMGVGASPADVYTGLNVATIATGGRDTTNKRITLTSNPFLATTEARILDSATDRFQVIDKTEFAVQYSCPSSSATPGDLLRRSSATTSFSGTGAVMARSVRCLAMDYSGNVAGAILQRVGIVYLHLQAFDPRCAATVSGSSTNGCESAEVVYQLHIDNSP